MRVPRWIPGSLIFLALALGTGFCAFTAFSLTQQTVIDLGRTGLLVEDPAQMIGCVFRGDWGCPQRSAPPPSPPESAPLILLTPLLTATPWAAPATSQPIMTATAAELTAPTPAPATATPAPDLPQITDPRQIRILLLGIDQRSAAGETGAFRSDTMMLMSVDPARKTVGVLSLPRDLWVSIPGYEDNRINTANFLGDRDAYPGGGGPALAMETVSQNLGLRVEKYLLINFEVFTTLVDMLAPQGVLINVTEAIDDPDYPDEGYGTVHVRFSPGPQRMDAENLLRYARTRATEGGDFDRALRQQQVLDAIRAEVLNAGGIVNIAAQAPRLWDELADNFRTNLSLNEALALGGLMLQIEPGDIRYEVVNHLYVNDGLSPGGEMVLYPNYAAIGDLVQRVFFPQSSLSAAEIAARAAAENAPIYVFNGTDQIGLANATREWLSAQGVTVAGVGNETGGGRANTEIRDYGGRHPWTARWLAGMLGLPDARIVRAGDGQIAQGVMIALGADALSIIEA